MFEGSQHNTNGYSMYGGTKVSTAKTCTQANIIILDASITYCRSKGRHNTYTHLVATMHMAVQPFPCPLLQPHATSCHTSRPSYSCHCLLYRLWSSSSCECLCCCSCSSLQVLPYVLHSTTHTSKHNAVLTRFIGRWGTEAMNTYCFQRSQ
jgi:hypothetical protein